MSEPLVEVVRSGFREGVHRGSVAVLGPDGALRYAIGDVRRPVFPRSSNKPMQLLAGLRSGFEVTDEADLALAAASHNGEPEHVRRALGLLAAAGLTETDLRCPPALPLHEPSAHAVLAAGGGPRRAAMNCSGKHAAMLATCVRQGWPTHSYLDPAHPLQDLVRDTIAELAGEDVAATGVDGCGAPLFAVSLTGLARAFLDLVTDDGDKDKRRIADAMRANPFLVAGTGRDDTDLMRAVPGVLSKGGAEGVHAVAMPGVGAVALKIEDGGSRARPPVLVGALRALGVADSAELRKLAEPPVLGGGEPVGLLRLLPDVFRKSA